MRLIVPQSLIEADQPEIFAIVGESGSGKDNLGKDGSAHGSRDRWHLTL